MMPAARGPLSLASRSTSTHRTPEPDCRYMPFCATYSETGQRLEEVVTGCANIECVAESAVQAHAELIADLEVEANQ